MHLIQICKDDKGEEITRYVFRNVLTIRNTDFGSSRMFYFVAIRPNQVLTGIIASLRGHFSLAMPKHAIENEGS